MEEREMEDNGDADHVTHSRHTHIHPRVSVNSN